MQCIFDSHIFDAILEKKITTGDMERLKSKGAEFYITHIQVDEINKCPNEDKRAILNLLMLKVAPKVIPTETFILGRSRSGEAKLGTAGVFEELQCGNVKHTEDALIGEVAIKNNMTLITDDIDLRKKVNNLNGNAITIDKLKQLMREKER